MREGELYLPKSSISIFLPINKVEKSTDSEDSQYAVTIAGWASTPTLDFQGEKVDPVGIDDSYFKDQGWIDYEHDTTTIIGVPTQNSFTDPDKGLYVEAKLFKSNKYVQKMLDVIENLKAIGSDRKIGFSIEGQINARDKEHPNIIRSILITGVAVTANPANPSALFDVVQKSLQAHNYGVEHGLLSDKSIQELLKKSNEPLTAGYGVSPDTQIDGAALRPESLAGSITNLSYALNAAQTTEELNQLARNVAEILDSKKSTNPYVNSVFLQIFKGMSRQDAKSILESESEE